MDTAQQEIKITIRLPAEIAARMRQLAKRNDRSLNGEIVRALREYTERQRQRHQDGP